MSCGICYEDELNPEHFENVNISEYLSRRIKVLQECLQKIKEKLETLDLTRISLPLEDQPWFPLYSKIKESLEMKLEAYMFLIEYLVDFNESINFGDMSDLLNFKLEVCFQDHDDYDDFFSQKFIRKVEMTSDDVQENEKTRILLLERFSICLEGHLDGISCIDVSIDYRYILTGSIDCKVKLWHYENLELISTFIKHKEAIRGAFFLNSNKSILSISCSGKIFFHYTNGEVIDKIKLKICSVISSALSRNEKILVMYSAENSFEILNLLNKTIKKLNINSSYNGQIELSSCGKKIVNIDNSNSFQIFDIKKNSEIKRVNDENGLGFCSRFSNDGTFIIHGLFDQRILIFYLKNNEKAYLTFHSDKISAIDISRNDELAVSADFHAIIIWNIHQRSKIRTHFLHNQIIKCLKFNCDSSEIISANTEGCLYKYFTDESKNFIKPSVYNKRVKIYILSQTLDLLATSPNNSTYHLWSIQTKKQLFEIQNIHGVKKVNKTKSGIFILISTGDLIYSFKDLKTFK